MRVRAEIDARLAQLRPARAEYEQLLGAAESLDADIANKPRASKKPRAVRRTVSGRRSAAQQAIVAALEHGSHTVGELTLVTAMSGASIREALRRLHGAGVVKRTRREGRVAYALSSAAD